MGKDESPGDSLRDLAAKVDKYKPRRGDLVMLQLLQLAVILRCGQRRLKVYTGGGQTLHAERGQVIPVYIGTSSVVNNFSGIMR